MTEEVMIDYTNYASKRRWRRVLPIRIVFQSSQWHSEKQWVLIAADVEREGDHREFTLADIHEWKPAKAGA